jgi:hypothetical protein
MSAQLGRFGSPIESNHRCRPTGYNVTSELFEFTTASHPFPWRRALAWSSLAGLAVLIASLFGIGV